MLAELDATGAGRNLGRLAEAQQPSLVLARARIDLAEMATARADVRAPAFAVKADADDTVVEVSDTRIGLSGEEPPHVFERFWRSDKSRARSRGGAGHRARHRP